MAKDADRLQTVLQSAGFESRATPIVLALARDAVGLPVRLGSALVRAGIGILFSYASRTEDERLCMVFKTTDDQRAIRVLEDSSLAYAT